MTRTEKARRRTASENVERGAAAVEFAILLPILVVIIFGVIAFGIAFARLETYISAAREGARFAAVHCQPDALSCTPALIATRVQDAAAGYPIGPGTPTADIDCAQNPGLAVTVAWPQSIPINIPLIPDLSKTVTIKGVFRCEG
jgi:Flp pilus assembly protein TadG